MNLCWWKKIKNWIFFLRKRNWTIPCQANWAVRLMYTLSNNRISIFVWFKTTKVYIYCTIVVDYVVIGIKINSLSDFTKTVASIFEFHPKVPFINRISKIEKCQTVQITKYNFMVWCDTSSTSIENCESKEKTLRAISNFMALIIMVFN